jgi:hypothetical protein
LIKALLGLTDTTGMSTSQVIRYYVESNGKARGWFVRTVVLDASGKETTGRNSGGTFPNKREAQEYADTRNNALLTARTPNP